MEAPARGRGRGQADDEDEERYERDTVTIHLPKIAPELRSWIRDLLPGRTLVRLLRNPPEDVRMHARAARRERLLAVRSFIDALIEENEQPGTSRRAREIEIE